MNKPIKMITFHNIRKKMAIPNVEDFDVAIIAKIATITYTRARI